MPIPNLILPRAAKCGTTSLTAYLDLHPRIKIVYPKKSHFFTFYNGHIDEVFQEPEEPQKEYYCNSATSYLPNPEALENIKKLTPETKFIVVLRHPVDRIISHYKWLVML